MKRVRTLVVGVLLVVASSAAMAFDVQQGAQAPNGAEVKTAPLGSSETPLGADLSMTESNNAPSGTEVRIPGLGRLGVLPKMDFGLELLYGAADPKQPEATEPSTDGVVVRGTVKHRF